MKTIILPAIAAIALLGACASSPEPVSNTSANAIERPVDMSKKDAKNWNRASKDINKAEKAKASANKDLRKQQAKLEDAQKDLRKREEKFDDAKDDVRKLENKIADAKSDLRKAEVRLSEAQSVQSQIDRRTTSLAEPEMAPEVETEMDDTLSGS